MREHTFAELGTAVTLVLGCATRDFIVQVSDRLISMPDGTVVDRNRNKCVILQGMAAFGYTGGAIAPNNVQTDIWLARVLTSYKGSSVTLYQWLADCAANELASQYYPFSFAGIGWFRLQTDVPMRAGQVVVTNHIDAIRGWRTGRRHGGFYLLTQTADAHAKVFFSTPIGATNLPHRGNGVLPGIWDTTKNLIRNAVRRKCGPEEIVRHLGAAIRQASAIQNAAGIWTVGRDLLVTVIPHVRGSYHDDLCTLMPGTPLSFDRPICYLLPENSGIPSWHGPTVAHNGWVVRMKSTIDSIDENGMGGQFWPGTGDAGIFMEHKGRRITVYIGPDGEPLTSNPHISFNAPNPGMAGVTFDPRKRLNLVPADDVTDLHADRTLIYGQGCTSCDMWQRVGFESLAKFFPIGTPLVDIAATFRCPFCSKVGCMVIKATRRA